MKNYCFLVPLLIFGFCIVDLSSAHSQTAIVNGMVTGVTKSEILVKAPAAGDSARISLAANTTLTDEVGNSISMDRVTEGQHVMVYYDMQNNRMVASKIILKTVIGANVESGATQKRDLNNSTAR